MRKKPHSLILLCICCLVVSLVAIFIFVPNESPPGTLPDPDTLPKYYFYPKNQLRQISFSQCLEHTDQNLAFVYIYDPESGDDKLILCQHPLVYIPTIEPTISSLIASLVIYSPHWETAGLDGLINALTGDFQATLENITYISNQEGHFLQNTTHSSSGLTLNEIINPAKIQQSQSPQSKQIFFGCFSKELLPDSTTVFHDLGNGTYLFLCGNTADIPSEHFQEKVQVLSRILERFSLTDIVDIN